MRLIVWMALFLALDGPCAAQTPAGANWDRVKQVDAGASIRVKSLARRRVACVMVRADDAQLVCSQTRTILFFPFTQQMVFPRDRVTEVRLTKPLLSGFAGAGIGLAAGVGAGYAVAAPYPSKEDGALLPFTFGILGSVIGAGIGTTVDIVGGPAIYRVP